MFCKEGVRGSNLLSSSSVQINRLTIGYTKGIRNENGIHAATGDSQSRHCSIETPTVVINEKEQCSNS